jgi:uncharacterized membrane protein
MIKREVLFKKMNIAYEKIISKPEIVFIVLFSLFGLAFIFIVPPFQNPDEPMHFHRSYQLSTLNISSEPNENGVYGGMIPVSILELVRDSEISHNFDYGFRFHLDYTKLMSYKYGGEERFEGFPNTAIYTPIVYAPLIISHWLVSLLDAPILATVYLGRIFSLLLVAIAVYFSIRLLPFGKWVLFAITLIPMFIASSVSMGADAVTYAVSILFVSLVLNLSFSKKKTSIKKIILLIGLVLAIGFIKQAHIPLLALLVLLPIFNSRFREKKVFILLGIAAAASFAIFLLWYVRTSGITINFNSSIQPELQKDLILSNPVVFLKVMLATYLTNNANGFIIGMFGNFGWLTATLPMLFIIISAIIVIFSVGTTSKNEQRLEKIFKITKTKTWFGLITIGVFCIVIAIISAALYLYWTPYQFGSILGIQGRYFLPILPLLLLPFVTQNAKNNSSRSAVIIAGCVIVAFVAIMVTIGRFYTNS